jgi:hypothetical protein
VAKETINKNRDNRLKQRYNERQIRKWRKQNLIFKNKKTAAKVSFWEDRQAKLIRKNPAMSRDYSRELVIALMKGKAVKRVL